MGFKTETIALTNLLLDEKNARLTDEQPNQAAALLALAREEDENLVNLAEDIVQQGMLNPLELPAVVPLDGEGPPYVVLEGNRRLAALKALESPDLIKVLYAPAVQKRLDRLHDEFLKSPIEEIQCNVFDTSSELDHWINLRHTGSNKGRGLSSWVPGQQDRYRARHRGAPPAPRSQVEDFVIRAGVLSDETLGSGRKVLTTIQRVINNPSARKALGISIENGEVRSHFPREQVLRGLTRLVRDLKDGEEDSRSLHSAKHIAGYVKKFKPAELPDPRTRLETSVPLSELAESLPTPPKPAASKKRRKKTTDPSDRRTAVPRKVTLNIDQKRPRDVFEELCGLDASEYTNAAAVLFRVFLEISCDHYVTKHTRGSWNDPLAKKMKAAADHLAATGAIDEPTRRMIARNADGKRFFAASLVTFHDWVHNRKSSPTREEIIAAWDELQPFFAALWP